MPKGKTVLNLRWHEPSNSALFEHIPFIVRPKANDLSDAQRANYRMRSLESYDGKDYWVYRLKCIPASAATIDLKETSIVRGTNNTIPFVADANDLAPVAPITRPAPPTPSTGKYLVAEAIIAVELTKSDIIEIREACRIIYGDVSYAELSEFALITGEDRNITGLGSKTLPVQYVEAIAAQCSSLVTSYYPLNSISAGLSISLSVGSSAPLSL